MQPAALVRMCRQICEEIGITVSIGLAPTKSLAKMASDRDKAQTAFLPLASSRPSWLAPQPVSVLFGLGKSAAGRLNAAGCGTCGDLVEADIRQLTAILGKQQSQDLATGIDARPVTTERIARACPAKPPC